MNHKTTSIKHRKMRLLNIVILLLLANIFLFACRKDEEQAVATPSVQQNVISTAFDGTQFPPLAVLPPIPFPPDNLYTQEKAELGEMLFFDPRMSGDGTIACNSCHPGTDGSWSVASPISFGFTGSTHWRNVQTLYNIAYYSKLNWDGGKTSPETQAKGAWTGAVAGNGDTVLAEERLAQIPEYVERFNDVFGDPYPTFNHALMAVATFERTIVSQNVPFDAYLQGDENAISEEAKQGFDLFTGKARCIACHNGAMASDISFHNTGVPMYPGFETNPLHQITFRFKQWSSGVTEEVYNDVTLDLGLYYETKLEEDKAKFRTQSLRGLCFSAPYMHNGIFTTLAEVVDFYNAGGGDNPHKDPVLQPLNLTDREKANLIIFLESLCGDPFIVEPPELPPYEVMGN
ncbi:MAG: cytochrome-c peroxidase [Chloroflexi bacterium]|nr:cytochrome-c peroxidase [Chloroflexota bacterium]